MKPIITFLLATIALVSGKGKLQKKGFVVEVQSHQQALKLANPIADLEQTISRGMNDPYTDPRFVMNQINAEFFGNSMKNTNPVGNIRNREMLAFRNLPINPLVMNSVSESSFPSNPIMQHAIKNNNMPMSQPALSIDDTLGKLMKIRNSLAAKKHVHKSKAPSRSLPYELPKIAANPPFSSNVKIAHVSSDSIQPSASKTEKASGRSFDSAVETGISGLEESQQTDAMSSTFTNSPEKSNFQVGFGEGSQNIGDTLSAMIEKNGPKSNDILRSNPGPISNNEMEENFSSIKAFMDADDVLRTKKEIEPVKNPLEDLLHSKHKKHVVPKTRRTLRKVLRSR